MRIIGKILKYLSIGVIIAVFVIFFFRCSLMKFPARSTSIFPSDDMKSAYAAGDFKVLTQTDIDDRITSDGRFTTHAMRYIPATGELIITVRYNDGVLKELAKEYEISEIDNTAEYFEYSLTCQDGTVKHPDAVDSFRVAMYNYRRLRYSGITTEDAEDLPLSVYYKEDSEEAFGTCIAYYNGWETSEYTLTKADIEELLK